MKGKTLTGKIYEILEIIYMGMIVNALFLIGTLAGGIIFGLGPSLIAANHLSKKYFEGKWDKPMRTFIYYYKKEFKRANRIMLPFQAVAIIYIADVYLLEVIGWNQQLAVNLIFTTISLVLLAYFSLIGPIYTFYDMSGKEFHRTTIQFAFRNSAPLLLGLVWLGICMAISSALPGLIPFLSIGIWIFINQGIYLQIFERNERLLEENKA